MRLNIFNKKRYIKESEMFPKNKEDFIDGLNNFMRNPDFNNPKATPYVIYITSICEYVNQKLEGKLKENQGAAIRINKVSSISVTFKVFIYNKSSLKDEILKHGGSLDFPIQETIEATNDDPYKIRIHLIDTGYGKSDIPNFYIQDDDTLYAKVNGKLLKATEAAESLVALYFNDLKGKVDNFENFNNENLFTAENVPLSSENIANNDVKEAIKVICADRKWNLSCKANALGILKFLKQAKVNKEMFTAKHPSWINKREKDIVINEYLDPSDIFLVKKGENIEDYKKKSKEEFNTSKTRTLGVSLKKLKLLIDCAVEQDKPSKEIFKTPNFFLTGWKEVTSPKVIYMKNIPDGFNSENNYIISKVFVTVSSSDKEGVPGKTMYFKCEVNGGEELLFTIRKNGGENFVLEAAGSEGTESQGGKCTPLITFVLGKEFGRILNIAIKNFKPAQCELRKIAITNGKKGNTDIVENELANIDKVLQEIQSYKDSYKDSYKVKNTETVKRAAIAFAFAKKLPFSSDESVNDLVEEAFNELGYEGDVYRPESKTPIFLGLGKDAYYSGN